MDIIKLPMLKEIRGKTIIAESICCALFCLLMHFADWNPAGYGHPLSIMVYMTVTIFLVFYFECVSIDHLKSILKDFIPKYLCLISIFGLFAILSVTFCKIRTIYFLPSDPLIGIWLVWVITMIIFCLRCENNEKEKKRINDLIISIKQTDSKYPLLLEGIEDLCHSNGTGYTAYELLQLKHKQVSTRKLIWSNNDVKNVYEILFKDSKDIKTIKKYFDLPSAKDMKGNQINGFHRPGVEKVFFDALGRKHHK